MACIGIFIGQCGVTIGQQILSDPPPLFKCYMATPHTLFVDTEIKVLRRTPKQYLMFSDFPGCGGCFAKGLSSAESLLDRIMEKVRVEIERTDCCLGFMLVHSLCGGTGSGFGSRITMELKSEYPEMFVVNVVVLPFQTGENPVQSYNVILALDRLQKYSDMIVAVENSFVAQELAGAKQKVSMYQLNEKIISDLQLMFRHSKQVPNRCSIWEILKIVCSIPTIKFCSVGSYFSRNVLENINCSARSIKQKTCFGKLRSTSGVVLNSDVKPQLLDQKMEHKLRKSFNFVEWNPFPVEFWCCKNKEPGINFVMNNECVSNTLDTISGSAMLKFNAGAYLHWFEKYDVHKEDFLSAFETVNKIVEDYAYFCR